MGERASIGLIGNTGERFNSHGGSKLNLSKKDDILGECMSEGYIGQIFNSLQGEGLYAGMRQVFVRFSGCSLDCRYCDTEKFRKFRPSLCEVEVKPSSMKFKRVQNPMPKGEVLRHVVRLKTPDVHSISLTGGEPLQAGDFLLDFARACRQAGLKTYLETNGASSEIMKNVADWIDIAAVDIKLPEHLAVPIRAWQGLLGEELSCVKISLEKGVEVFVKVVVLKSTRERTIEQVARELVRVGDVPLVLQPVTPSRWVRSAPSMASLFQFARAAARAGVKDIAIIPQIHKLIEVY